jgi:hypothetical protein
VDLAVRCQRGAGSDEEHARDHLLLLLVVVVLCVCVCVWGGGCDGGVCGPFVGGDGGCVCVCVCVLGGGG